MRWWVIRAAWAASAAVCLAAPGCRNPGIEGHWTGVIRVMGQALNITTDFKRTGSALTGTIDIPQQNAHGMPLQSLSETAGAVQFEIRSPIGTAKFDGKEQKDRIDGSFSQGPVTGTFQLKRGDS